MTTKKDKVPKGCEDFWKDFFIRISLLGLAVGGLFLLANLDPLWCHDEYA